MINIDTSALDDLIKQIKIDYCKTVIKNKTEELQLLEEVKEENVKAC